MEKIHTLSSLLLLIALILSGANAMAQTAGITVGTASMLPGGVVNVPITFTAGSMPISTLQFDLTIPAQLGYEGISAGAAAVAASKSLSFSAIAGGIRVLIFGLNNGVIGPGVIANIQIRISATAPGGAIPISVNGLVASDPNAGDVGLIGSNGYVRVISTANATPTQITEIAVSNVTSRSATISWKTDAPSDSVVEYWLTDDAVNKSVSPDMVTIHQLTLNGLQKRSQYKFRIKSSDLEGNQVVTLVLTFDTAGAGSFAVSLPRYSAIANPQGSGGDSSVVIGMALANAGFLSASLTFTAIDDNGNLTTGPGIVNPKTISLAGQEQRALMDLDVFGNGIANSSRNGWIKLESTNSDVDGFFLTFDRDLTIMDGASLGFATLKTFVFTQIETAGLTKINLVNPSSTAANVRIDVMKADGTVRDSRTRAIGGNAALVADVFKDLFTGIAPDHADYLRIRSTEGVHSFEMMQRNGGDITSLIGQDITAGGTVLYSPQYAMGGLWNTVLSVVNLDSRAGTATLRLVGENGIQIGNSRTEAIPANGKIRIDDAGYFAPLDGGTTTSGYVQIESDGIRLAGSVMFGDRSNQSFASALPLICGLKNEVLYSHVASDDRYYTGIAVLNPLANGATIEIEIYEADGDLYGRRIFTLPARQKRAQLLTELFQSMAGEAWVSGHIRVKSDVPMASFSLFGTHNLSVLSAIPPQ